MARDFCTGFPDRILSGIPYNIGPSDGRSDGARDRVARTGNFADDVAAKNCLHQQAVLHRITGQFGIAAESHLFHDAGAVSGDGMRAQMQHFGDLDQAFTGGDAF